MRLTTKGKALLALLAAALISVGALVVASGSSDEEPRGGRTAPELDDDRSFSTNDPVERACGLNGSYLARIWRGYHPVHSEDITTVPHEPNYSGSFRVASHSGPWDDVQNVPLVLYGPGFIKSGGAPLEQQASIADIYPTVGKLLDVPLEKRAGKVLRDALEETDRIPKLVVVVVWDGVGRNGLERWDDRWPVLSRLEKEGTSYLGATVGSSPSITPATHSTIGTGAYPRKHGMTAIVMRNEDGTTQNAFPSKNPSGLKLSTFADQIDAALGNEPLVGILAWKSWQIGMMSHGAALSGGDADHMALVETGANFRANENFYSLPEYLSSRERLDEAIDELDLADGEADGEWRGRPIEEKHDNPAWVNWEIERTLEMLGREDYGRDDVPDLFFTNYKMTDIVGHQYGVASPEMGDVLEAQDAALGRLLDHLDEEVEDYVLMLTADHGFPPPAEETGAWPIGQGELERDVNRHFDVPSEESLLAQTSAAGPFLDREVQAELGVSEMDIARFLNGYTIADNVNEEESELPEEFEGREDEPVFEAVFPSDSIPEIMRCAFPK
jgi:predicted AlkP superfamily pyrophosphatase or phosphodiesterase